VTRYKYFIFYTVFDFQIKRKKEKKLREEEPPKTPRPGDPLKIYISFEARYVPQIWYLDDDQI
jgi:hypothetical protein